MKIKVLQNVGGDFTNEARILPGTYDANDAALFGAASVLVARGQAIIIDEIPDQPDVQDGESPAPQQPRQRKRRTSEG